MKQLKKVNEFRLSADRFQSLDSKAKSNPLTLEEVLERNVKNFCLSNKYFSLHR